MTNDDHRATIHDYSLVMLLITPWRNLYKPLPLVRDRIITKKKIEKRIAREFYWAVFCNLVIFKIFTVIILKDKF